MSLEFSFQRRRGDFCLDMSGTLEEGVTGIFGPSGAGKTTLLHLLAGIERPDSGFLRWRGLPIVDTDSGKWTPPHKRGMAVVFQQARLFPHMTVTQNLRYGELHLPHDARRFALPDVIELLKLKSLISKPITGLSGGEAQRVALGRALMSSPHLLLLDEPFASLDKSMRKEILPYLLTIKKQMGIPMVYVSHDLGFMLQLVDQLLVVKGGRCLGKGHLLELVQNSEVAHLMDEHGLINVATTQVLEVDRAKDLILLGMEKAHKPAIGAHPWLGPAWKLTAKTRLQIGLRPNDISLALEPVPKMTVQNQIPGIVEQIIEDGPAAKCIVDVGIPLLVEMTSHAAKTLALKPGKPVYVFFKAQALQFLGAL